MSKRILILIGGHLSTAPRARKEALALMEAGYEVEVRGVWFDDRAVAEDLAMMARTGICFAPALDFRAGGWRRSVHRMGIRMRARLAREKFLRAGRFSPELLGYGARELLAVALSRRPDLTIVHSEAGLWVARELLAREFRVGIDFEDWFSRDLPVSARRARPFAMLEKLEQAVARDARYVLAPSRAMASALEQSYSISRPEVVYNSFPWAERSAMDGLRKDRGDASAPSVHWFSQHIGPDRGLELLFAALPLLDHRIGIYLRGACSETTRRWLDQSISAGFRERVTVLPPVSNAELLSRIAEHDIGLALESAKIESRDLCVSNKIFQYLQAG
jgi:glycosyltransferase involved in cell wall biosynthesis